MPDDPKDLKLVDGAAGADPAEDAPRGCFALWGALGMAAYAFLVLGMLLAGLVGIFGASVAMVLRNAGSGGALMSGTEADSWRLSELRGVGILGEGVTPPAYHDHSRQIDGSAGCMIAGDEVVQWEAWAEVGRVPIAGAALTVEGPDEAPTVSLSGGGSTVRCPFDEEQGGDRFARMLKAEIRRSETP